MSKYIEVNYVGLRCYTDSYIASNNGYLFYISLFGRPALVKALTAVILGGKSIFVGEQMVVKASSRTETFTQNFKRGLVHKVILSSEYFKGPDVRIVIGKDRQRAFQFLDSVVTTPLKKTWADWLWGKAFEPEPLKGFGSIDSKDVSEAWLIRLTKTTDEIDELVLEGLKSQEIN